MEKYSTLTERETEIKELILQGKNRRKIADKLVISIKTVGTHINHIYKKLNIHSRYEIFVQEIQRLKVLIN